VNGGAGAFNDLTVSLTGDDVTTPNGIFTHHIQVSNLGSDPALNVTVRDVLPAGVSFVSAKDSAATNVNPSPPGAFTCSQAAGVVECVGATILPGSPRVVDVKMQAPNALVPLGLLNAAIVDPDNKIPEGDELNNGATKTTNVSSPVNLKAVVTGPPTSSQSQTTDYVITVWNEEHDVGGVHGRTLTGVKMHDALPVGLIPLAVDTGDGNNWGCQIAENPVNVVDCVGDLPPVADQNGGVKIKITVFMTAESGRSLDNVACVDPDNVVVETDESDNCSEHATLTVPPKPDLLVNTSVDKTTASPFDVLEYTVNVSNIGTADAPSPITVTDKLPPPIGVNPTVTFIDASGPNGWTCAESAGVVTCDDAGVGTGLAPGQSVQIRVHAMVTAAATGVLVDVGTATAVPDELDPGNNSGTAKTAVGSAGFDLVISSITDNPDPVNPGKVLTYTVVAVNGGTQPAPGVHVKIDLPGSGVVFVGADGSNGFNCGAPSFGSVDCAGDLPAGGDTVITVKLAVMNPGAPPDLSLTATIDPTNAFAETDEGNNTKTEVTTVSGYVCTDSCVDLVSAQMQPSAEPVHDGKELTFKYTVVNTGDTSTAAFPGGARTIYFDLYGSVSDALPTDPSGTFVCTRDDARLYPLEGYIPGVWALAICTGNGGSATGQLGPGQGVTFSLTVTAHTGGLFGDVVVADGIADPDNTLAEFNEDNNEIVRTVDVVSP
jgi:uncharacterized repeat protein (TIGR01451 family)